MAWMLAALQSSCCDVYPKMNTVILILDHYDSFTFNLQQQVARLSGVTPIVIRHDHITLDAIKTLAPAAIILSPGPGRADKASDFAIGKHVILDLNLPVLGVCLGHQGLCCAYGGRLVAARQLIHGRLSPITHNSNDPLFHGIPRRFSAVRYHSLAIATADLPSELEPLAWDPEGELMAVRHRKRPLWGVQFHPESIASEYGDHLIGNFLKTSQNDAPSNLSTQRQTHNKTQTFQKKPSRPAPNPFLIHYHKLTLESLSNVEATEAIFLHLYSASANAFWLDSASDNGRFSFMGDSSGPHSYLLTYNSRHRQLTLSYPNQNVTAQDGLEKNTDSIFNFLSRRLSKNATPPPPKLPFDFNGGFVGYFGYELKSECGPTPSNPSCYTSPLPDAAFIFADRFLAFDHDENALYLVALSREPDHHNTATAQWFTSIESRLRSLPIPPPPSRLSATITSTFSRCGTPWRKHISHQDCVEPYLADIETCQKAIHSGETYQVCLTDHVVLDTPIRHPLETYRRLRCLNPAPYAAYFKYGSQALLCTSPERFLRIELDREKGHRIVSSKPIKGTCKRASQKAEDQRRRNALRQSTKDRSENLMIVDLVRNDLSKVCEIGSIRVPQLMEVESFAMIHHLVSTIEGRLRADVDALDCVRNTFPPGSMTGAPKIRTLQILDHIEKQARGPYSGSLGFLALSGAAELNVIIRTLVSTPSTTSIGTGGGIVALSDPQKEFNEIQLKARSVLRAL